MYKIFIIMSLSISVIFSSCNQNKIISIEKGTVDYNICRKLEFN